MFKDFEKGKYLKPIYFVLDNGLVFSDKLLPDPTFQLTPDAIYYTPDYFVNLHYSVSSFNSYNHLGA